MIKLAFSGKMRSGKDTACDYVVKALNEDGFSVKRLAFADTIKELATIIQTTCGFPIERDRELMQWLGTDYGRKRNQNVWVDALERKIKSEENEDTFLAVTDVRFPNELQMLKRNGFILVRIKADDDVRQKRGAEPGTLSHASETALDLADLMGSFDIYIENNGSIEDFYNKLNELVAYAWKQTALR